MNARPAAALAMGVLLALALLVLARSPIGDPDYFWHLAAGRWSAVHGVPRTDPFSFTANGAPWVAHEWGFERLVATLERFAGARGAAALWRVAAGGLALALVASALQLAGAGPVGVAVFALVLAATRPLWSERPHLATLAGLAFIAWASERWRRGSRGAAFAFPLVALAWANLHGGAVLGVALYGAWAVGAAWEEKRWRLAVPAALAVLALLATPNGAALLAFALRPLRGDEMVSGNPDWGPPELWRASTWCTLALALAWPACLALARRRPLPSEWLPALALLPFALTQRRALPLFAVLVAPLAARAATLALYKKYNPYETYNPYISGAPAATLAATLLVCVAFRPSPPLEAGFFPVAAVGCLGAARPAGGNLLAVYHWGGYAEDALWPAWRPFIDGRADAFPDDVHADYRAIAEAAPDAGARLDRRRVDAVLWPSAPEWSTLPDALVKLGWRPLCRDPVATAWVR